MTLQEILDDPLLEHLKIILIAEKAGDADQDFLGQKPHLLRIIGHVVDILPEIAVVGDYDPALYAPQDSGLFIIRIVDVRDVFQDGKDLRHQVPVRQLQPLPRIRHGPRDMRHLPGDTVRVQDQVGKTGRDRTARHAVKLRALRGLHDDQTVSLLDRPDPVGSVRPCAGQNDRHRPVFIGLGQRAEKNIDRVIDMLVVILMQMQDTCLDLHVVLGRKHDDRILADIHPVLGLHDLHGSIFCQDVRQKAAVIRRQMLDHYESHSRIRGQKRQKLLKRLQSACRGSDSNHTARLLALFDLRSLHDSLPRAFPAHKVKIVYLRSKLRRGFLHMPDLPASCGTPFLSHRRVGPAMKRFFFPCAHLRPKPRDLHVKR